MKLDILAIGVHPDDVELSCSGTLLKHISMGYSVGLLDLTKGELGTRGTPEIRTQEALDAAQIMGASVREQLDLADGFFVQNEESLRKIIEVIRRYSPEIVFANALDDRHPDHGRAAKLTAEACFLSGLRRIETFERDGTTQVAWRPKAVYHYIQDRILKPDFVVDTSDFIDKKQVLIHAFKSQFYDPLSKEPVTPISSPEFLQVILGKEANFGRFIGATYAEGFNTSRVMGINDVFDFI
jgi:N-acetylglucosamine malate deacetylase 1